VPCPQIQSAWFSVPSDNGYQAADVIETEDARDRWQSFGSGPRGDLDRGPPVTARKAALARDAQEDNFRTADAGDLRKRPVRLRWSAACTEERGRDRDSTEDPESERHEEKLSPHAALTNPSPQPEKGGVHGESQDNVQS
jgi:hypothetical protein